MGGNVHSVNIKTALENAQMSYPDPRHYPGLAFIGPIPMIKRVASNGTVMYVTDWKKLSPDALMRVQAEIDYVEDCCYDKGKL